MKKSNLKLLEGAVSEAGHWVWYGLTPEACQLEFSDVQLYMPTIKTQEPHSSNIALRFSGNTFLSFYDLGNLEEITLENKFDKEQSKDTSWYELLANDELKPFKISTDEFSFGDYELIKNIVENYKREIRVLYTPEYKDAKAPISQIVELDHVLSFRASFYSDEKTKNYKKSVAVVVGGNHLDIFDAHGQVEENKIKDKSNRWWVYWHDYWKKKQTPEEYKKDIACETFPP